MFLTLAVAWMFVQRLLVLEKHLFAQIGASIEIFNRAGFATGCCCLEVYL